MRDTGDVPLPLPEDLDDVLAVWRVREVASAHSPRTIDSRLSMMRRLARTVDPLTATTDDLLEWLAGLAAARSSMATYRSTLRAFYKFLVVTGRREDDPAADLPPVKAPRGLPHPVTPAEVKRILLACGDGRARRTRAYVILAAYAGLRVHEIAKVRGEDFAGAEIAVTGKGGVVSTVPMHPRVAELVEQMPTSGYWFPSDAPSGHVHRCSVSSAIARAMARAGVAGVPHALRHHFCTQVLRSSGGDLRTTQRAARHASPATTAIYTQIADETLTRAVFGIPD